MSAKIFIISLMVFILVALGRGLYFLLQDKGKSNRTVYSLTWRIALSFSLFILLFIGYMLGYIQPHPPGF